MSGKPLVLLSRPLPESVLAPLRDVAEVEIWQRQTQIDRAALLSSMARAQGLICMLTERVDRELLQHSPKLQAVSSMSVGVDHIDLDALAERGIALGNTPGVLVETTADLVFALLLTAARRVCEDDRFVRAGNWIPQNRWAPDMMLGRDIHGATLGIIGLGDIGRAVARRAAGFDMSVLSWTRSGRQLPGLESVSLERLLAQSDFISVNVALEPETRLLLDASAIARIKPGAVLVNAARGGIVDDHALHRALQSGQLSAAGIDVFEREPVAHDSPLLSLPNVVLTPHIGSATEATRLQMASMAVANMVAALEGAVMPHCVNPEVYR